MIRSAPTRAGLRVAAAATLVACALLPAARAAADPLPVTLANRAGRVAATIDLGPLLPKDLPARLGNGLRNVVAVYVGVVPIGHEQPTAGFARIVEVLYDVWEESWSLTIRDPGARVARREILRGLPELRAALAHAADADLGPVSALPPTPFTVDVRIDLNPISPELLAHTREYLAGGSNARGASRSVLGAVAGFLLREPDEEGETLFFRSRPMSSDAVLPR